EQQQCTKKYLREITIQLSKELFFSNLIYKNQFNSIQYMLNNSQKGVSFPMESIMKLYRTLDTLSGEQSGLHTVIKLLNILYELSLYDSYRTLASSSFAHIEENTDSRRVRNIYDYINKHFQEEIRLDDLSGIVSMTPAAL